MVDVSITTGVSYADLADLDILSFSALAEVVTRVGSRRKSENAWTTMIAAQGTKDSMEKLTALWSKGKDVKDGTSFLKDLNIGGTGSI